MGLFDFFKKKDDAPVERPKADPSVDIKLDLPDEPRVKNEPVIEEPDTEKEDLKLDEVLAGVNKYCAPKPVVKFKVTTEATTIFDSKIGGVPYFPKTMEYPRGKSFEYEGQPLVLLAQINLSQIPELPDFPHEGILQFFIAGDDLYGMAPESDNLDVQDDFRIVYHKEIIDDLSQLMTAEDIPQYGGEDETYFPFTGEYKLVAETADQMPVTTSDYRFEDAFVSSYNELHETPIKQLWDVDCDVLYDDMDDFPDAIMGGYPMFTQSDPREDSKFAVYDTVLFELDSVYEDGIDISWGDGGTGTFLIARDALLNCDFSKVLYNYDCM